MVLEIIGCKIDKSVCLGVGFIVWAPSMMRTISHIRVSQKSSTDEKVSEVHCLDPPS